MGCMNTSATYPLCSAARTLTSATSPFLLIRLCATTSYLTSYFGVMSTETCICHLTNISLVHQIYINWGLKDRGGKFHLTQLFARYIQTLSFHSYLAPISPAVATAFEPL